MNDVLLIATISPMPRFVLARWSPPSRVEIAGDEFEDTASGDANGFYDFLRHNGHIVGVRFTPFVMQKRIWKTAVAGLGLRKEGTLPTASFELFFRVVKDYDPYES